MALWTYIYFAYNTVMFNTKRWRAGGVGNKRDKDATEEFPHVTNVKEQLRE